MFDFVTLFSDFSTASNRLTSAVHGLAEAVEQRTGRETATSPAELPAAQPVKVRRKPGRKPRQPVESNGAPHTEPVLS